MDRKHRTLAGIGALLAAFGGWRLAQVDPEIGAGFPVIPISTLLVGAVLFALGGRFDRAPRALAPSPSDALPRPGRRLTIAALIASALAVTLYAAVGYRPVLLPLWIGSLILASFGARSTARFDWGDFRAGRAELLFLGALLVGSALLLFPFLDVLPFVISTDEIYYTLAVEGFADGTTSNPLGLSDWWGLPALHFAAVATLTPILGTSLEAMRFVTAVIALLTLVPFYFWVRMLHGTRLAMVAVSLFAFAHAFIGWGRFALHQNAPVLLVVVAMALLAWGIQRSSSIQVLWGGMVLGLGFYTYPSGQVAILVWLVALACWGLTRALPAKTLASLLLLSGLGFVLVAAPMAVNAVTDFGDITKRAQAVAITNPEALERLAGLWGLETTGEALRENLKRGFLALNSPYPYVTYFNRGHPFVDPATGTLLWMGLCLSIAYLRRPALLLGSVGFLLVYASNLVTEGAPVHGRLLIGLPFVALLAAEALVRGVDLLPISRARIRQSVLIGAIVIVAGLNFNAYSDYANYQMTSGKNDAVAAIGRTLDKRIRLEGPIARFFAQDPRWNPRHRVVYFTDETHQTFRWGTAHEWREWISFFSDSAYVHEWETMDEFLEDRSSLIWGELTLFLPTDIAVRYDSLLAVRYPYVRREAITPNRRLSAIHIVR